MQFQKAVRKRAKVRLALAGPSGSGKSYSALLIAQGLGGKIAVIDTERGSASLYSHLVEFDTLELSPPFTPERFIEAIKSASAAGYTTCIIDSITHEWDGAGGCLESNEEMAHAKFKGNTWAAWSETTPRHRAFIDAMLQAPMHVIATLRTKTDTVQVDGKVKKLGMKAVQREGIEFEYAVVFDLEHEKHWAVASKDRTGLFHEPHVISPDTGARILSWLESGEVQRLTDVEVADYLDSIATASDMDALLRCYKAAYHAADVIEDSAARFRFVEAKDKRKKALAPQEVAA